MLAYLDGILTQQQPGICVIDINGAGFLLQVPVSQAYTQLKTDERIKLHTHFHVREDAISIFGFLSNEEKELFLMLISVSGIGPKNAVNILSFASPNILCSWLLQEDVGSLKKIPGVGAKTAQRLILELKSKISNLEWTDQSFAPPASQSVGLNSQEEEALEAMLSLGYDLRQAKAQVLKAAEKHPGAGVEVLIKEALQMMLRL